MFVVYDRSLMSFSGPVSPIIIVLRTSFGVDRPTSGMWTAFVNPWSAAKLIQKRDRVAFIVGVTR
jgi:hypothetical protein